MQYTLPETLLQRIVNILAQLPYGQVREVMREVEKLRPSDERAASTDRD
jgi:hypothetical protein